MFHLNYSKYKSRALLHHLGEQILPQHSCSIYRLFLEEFTKFEIFMGFLIEMVLVFGFVGRTCLLSRTRYFYWKIFTFRGLLISKYPIYVPPIRIAGRHLQTPACSLVCHQTTKRTAPAGIQPEPQLRDTGRNAHNPSIAVKSQGNQTKAHLTTNFKILKKC